MRANRPAAGKRTIALLISIGLLCTAVNSSANDKRQVFNGTDPAWLSAVGKLHVPGQRIRDGHQSNYLEDCSAVLIASPGRTEADIILTAWHCLELYRDLSKPIKFTTVEISGEPLLREARRLADGGSMDNDWAILRLHAPVSADKVVALPVHPQRANPSQSVMMAGFSRDSGIGDYGRTLTFDPVCTITVQEQTIGDTNCTAHKGASGGAVIQLSSNGEPRMCGVISQGNGESRSTYVPVNAFRRAINLYIQ